jgi:hypothetical protein
VGRKRKGTVLAVDLLEYGKTFGFGIRGNIIHGGMRNILYSLLSGIL